MAAIRHYVEVPVAKTVFSTSTSSDIDLPRTPAHVKPAVVVTDRSILDPGKYDSRKIHSSSENLGVSRSRSLDFSGGETSSSGRPSDSSLTDKASQENTAECHEVLSNDPVLDPKRENIVLGNDNETINCSYNSGNYSLSARVPDGQTDDTADHSFLQDFKDDYLWENDAEYTPSNSDGYLPSGYESDEHETPDKTKKRSNAKKKSVKPAGKTKKSKKAINRSSKKSRLITATYQRVVNDLKTTYAAAYPKRTHPYLKNQTTKEHEKRCINKGTKKVKGTKLSQKQRETHSRITGTYQGKLGASSSKRTKAVSGMSTTQKSKPKSKKSSCKKSGGRKKKKGKFLNPEEEVTQMSLLGIEDEDDTDTQEKNDPKPQGKTHPDYGKVLQRMYPNLLKEEEVPLSYSSKQLLIEQLFKWKNDYMRGLSMYIEDQLRRLDKNHFLSWNTLSTDTATKKKKKHKKKLTPRKRFPSDLERKPRHTGQKKPVSIMKLKSVWSRPGTASNSGKVLPRLLMSSDKVSPLGSEIAKQRLRKELRVSLKKMRLPRNSLKVLAASDIKLVSHTGQLVMVGEGATSICVLGNLKAEKTFVVVKMFKLPYGGGRTREIIDQSVLAKHLNSNGVTPKFYGLVALDLKESLVVGVHDVGMAFKFIGHTPSCATTTLSSLCEKAATSQMYRDPDADTSTGQLNAVKIIRDVIAAINKVHYDETVMPGLDPCKVLLSEEEGTTRPYLSSKLHPMKIHCLAWHTIAYLGLKNSLSCSYSQNTETVVPPESIRRGTFSIKSDIFQLGKMMMCAGQAFNISSLQYLARRCLRQDPLHRPDMPKILSEVENIVQEFQRKQ